MAVASRAFWALLGAVVVLLAIDGYRLRLENSKLRRELSSTLTSVHQAIDLAGNRRRTIGTCYAALTECQTVVDEHLVRVSYLVKE